MIIKDIEGVHIVPHWTAEQYRVLRNDGYIGSHIMQPQTQTLDVINLDTTQWLSQSEEGGYERGFPCSRSAHDTNLGMKRYRY